MVGWTKFSVPLVNLWYLGRYVGSRPIKLSKSNWKDRNVDVVKEKQHLKKKMGYKYWVIVNVLSSPCFLSCKTDLSHCLQQLANKFKSSSDESVWASMPSGAETVCAENLAIIRKVIFPWDQAFSSSCILTCSHCSGSLKERLVLEEGYLRSWQHQNLRMCKD